MSRSEDTISSANENESCMMHSFDVKYVNIELSYFASVYDGVFISERMNWRVGQGTSADICMLIKPCN